MNAVLMRSLTVFAAAAGIVFAGCGGGELSNDEYATELQTIFTDYQEDSTALGGEMTQAATPDAARSGIDELIGLTEATIENLDSLEPPDDASDGHEALISGMEDLLDDLEGLSDDIESDDPAELQQALADFQTAAVDSQAALNDALAQLEEAGIEEPTP